MSTSCSWWWRRSCSRLAGSRAALARTQRKTPRIHWGLCQGVPDTPTIPPTRNRRPRPGAVSIVRRRALRPYNTRAPARGNGGARIRTEAARLATSPATQSRGRAGRIAMHRIAVIAIGLLARHVRRRSAAHGGRRLVPPGRGQEARDALAAGRRRHAGRRLRERRRDLGQPGLLGRPGRSHVRPGAGLSPRASGSGGRRWSTRPAPTSPSSRTRAACWRAQAAGCSAPGSTASRCGPASARLA